MEEIIVYTDGACSGNPGPGGWGVVLQYQDRQEEFAGFVAATTNNRMELTAVVQGLAAIENFVKKEGLPVTIYSDSRYVTDAINQNWLSNWLIRNWCNSSKLPVANRDLWEQIVTFNRKYHPTYVWIKGHASNVYNNRCDEIAVKAIKDGLRQMQIQQQKEQEEQQKQATDETKN